MSLVAVAVVQSTPSAAHRLATSPRYSAACCSASSANFSGVVGSISAPSPKYAIGYSGLAKKAVIRAPASLANDTARFAVARDSSEPSVGTKICLNMLYLLSGSVSSQSGGRFPALWKNARMTTSVAFRLVEDHATPSREEFKH